MSDEPHKTVIAPATVLAPPSDAKIGDENIAPTTTAAQDRREAGERTSAELTSAGQRAINLIWENTQMKIALAAVYAALCVAAGIVIMGMLPWSNAAQIALAVTAFVLLSNLATLVIGFYFGRTNHTRTGGVGGGDSKER